MRVRVGLVLSKPGPQISKLAKNYPNLALKLYLRNKSPCFKGFLRVGSLSYGQIDGPTFSIKLFMYLDSSSYISSGQPFDGTTSYSSKIGGYPLHSDHLYFDWHVFKSGPIYNCSLPKVKDCSFRAYFFLCNFLFLLCPNMHMFPSLAAFPFSHDFLSIQSSLSKIKGAIINWKKKTQSFGEIRDLYALIKKRKIDLFKKIRGAYGVHKHVEWR